MIPDDVIDALAMLDELETRGEPLLAEERRLDEARARAARRMLAANEERQRAEKAWQKFTAGPIDSLKAKIEQARGDLGESLRRDGCVGAFRDGSLVIDLREAASLTRDDLCVIPARKILGLVERLAERRDYVVP